jgi:hypothetical protein
MSNKRIERAEIGVLKIVKIKQDKGTIKVDLNLQKAGLKHEEHEQFVTDKDELAFLANNGQGIKNVKVKPIVIVKQ